MAKFVLNNIKNNRSTTKAAEKFGQVDEVVKEAARRIAEPESSSPTLVVAAFQSSI